MVPIYARFSLKFTACLTLAFRLAAQDPVPDLFNGRDLKRTPAALNQKWAGEKISTQFYSQIKPGRSLLLYDCAPPSWCQQNGFNFASIATIAAGIAHQTPDAFASQWYQSAVAALFANFSTQVAPWNGASLSANAFQLLAVVNRLDLAKWQDKKWTQAEMRFVYGPGAYGSTNLTLILEFVLPEMDGPGFLALAQSWFNLSKPKADVAAGLLAIMNQSRLEQSRLVRIRLNHQRSDGPWEFGEWDFGPGKPPPIAPCDNSARTKPTPAGAFAHAPLQDQIAITPRTPAYQTYLSLWTKIPPNTANPPTSITIPPCLQESEIEPVPDQSLGMSTPIGLCKPDETIRNILALQQCSFCHTTETNTKFNHITNRDPKRNSTLSGFLTGGATGPNLVLPSIDSLVAAGPGTAFEVTVRYDRYVGAACEGQPESKTVQRAFHDLVRRALFLSAVLLAGNDPTASIANINAFRTDFAH